MRALLLGAALILGGCRLILTDVPVVVMSDPEPPPAPPPSAPPTGHVLAVKEIKADRVFARVVVAKEVHARGGRIGRVFQEEQKRDWGGQELRAPEVHADTIYAKEIHCDWIEASEIYAKEVKVGR